MTIPRTLLLLGAAFLLAPCNTARTQEPARPLFSLGQPPRWQPYVDALARAPGSDGAGAVVLAGVQRPMLNPVAGLISPAAELYADMGQGTAGGARLLARSPALALAAGADWRLRSGHAGEVDLLLSWQSAIRRGGLLGRGTMLRVDWLPTRDHSFAVGVHLPLLQPMAGRTRRRETAAPLPRHPGAADAGGATLSPDIGEALGRAERAMRALSAYSNAWSDAAVRHLSASPDYGATVREYDAALARAFALAAGDSAAGAAIAARARAGLLDAVLLPYDSLFGRPKAPGDDIRMLTGDAHARFLRWYADSAPGTRAPGAPGTRVPVAHARWLAAVARLHRDRLAERGGDSRFVWLPLQLALRPEQFDEQAEVDSLIARAVGRPFTDGNAMTYLHSRDLPLEIARSIHTARRYHVLWLHDFAGRPPERQRVDALSFATVADAYFPALTEAVRRYDSTGVLPVWLIVHDQHFYEQNHGRIWMTVLEDPLGASTSLPGDNAPLEARLRKRQAELRAAVAGSRRLQQEAARNGGDEWLRRVVKVHVSVMQPSDFSFRSHRLVPPFPFAPDNLMRDHRKLVLYDLTEASPFEGAAILMGVGVGEHYGSGTWEDRGYRLRGPAALEARAALRRVLRRNGFDDADIPVPLREVASAARVEERLDQGDYVGRALQVHNDVGWGAKHASVARAVLYDLAQPGSIVVVPDQLWLSDEWAGMLAGAAARGAHVHAIAPALANAPLRQPPVIALMHETMRRMLELRRALAEPLRRSGGELRVGLFAARAEVDDPAGRQVEVREGIRRTPWLREVFPLDPATLAVLDRVQRRTASDGPDATDVARDDEPRAPQLHQKTQLVARPGAIAALLRQPGWDDALAAAMTVQSRHSADFAAQLGDADPALDSLATRRSDAMLRGFEAAIPERDRKRVSFYFLVGSHNEDPRGLALDGEATLVTSGFQGATGFVDLYYLMARSRWIESEAALDELLPRGSRLMRILSRLARPTL